MRVLIRGAGVAGLTAAYELATRGADIMVVEREPAIGAGASRLAGGMLAPFCEAESADRSVITLGESAARWWEKTLPGLVRFEGTLVVAPPRDVAELRRFAVRTEGHAHLSADELATLEPDLAGRFRAGLFFAHEAHVDPRRALLRLHKRLHGFGVRFLFGQTKPPTGARFDRMVDCTGMGAGETDKALRGVRGEMIILRTRDVALTRPVRLLHPRIPVYLVPRGDGCFMVGATMIENDADGPITARSAMELLNAAYGLHPAFGEAEIIETGAGIRPAYPDNLPRVQEDGAEISINGFYRHGFLFAPAMARRAADFIFGKQATRELHHETFDKRPSPAGVVRDAR
ncbi:glycine oxidase ThiO [Mesorhizobium sp. WSM2239]|uniref:Glycine oxidase ThiO n=2 Tax=unclassified Mesorhizobium TaxID=325217 RepID=A0AAU8DJV6_9HYPH